ncbi:MAG: 50S ribosomal protein L13 [Acidobacteriia bacterium]|nr:50S ribosomal protein L13 [Terriglobia bacterium]
MSTHFTKASEIRSKWYVIDASGVVLGRLATTVAKLLIGKTKASYVPYLDGGDHVVIVNADKVKITGKKMDQKFYHRFSGYPGGIKSISLKDQLAKHPTRVVEDAVTGMLPKSKLGRAMAKKLRVYAAPSHPHSAQKLEPYLIKQ